MKKFYLIPILLFALSANGQDFHLSQYEAAALNQNPAMTGMFKGQLRVHGHYRNQWSAIATRPFTTGIIAADMPLKKIAVGMQVANFNAGAGHYNVFSALLSLAYDFKIDQNNHHHISFGVQGGAFQKSVQFDKLYFGTQYTPFNGGSFDQSINPGESFAGNSVIKGDLNAGLLYYYGKETALLNPFAGVSFFHINQPKESFFNANNPLPMRWVAHGGVKANISEKIQLLGKAFYMGEKNARELTYALDIHYYLAGPDAYLLFGPTFRNKDAAVIMGGLKMGSFIYRLSYDINTSSLRPATNGRGGFEMSLTYIRSKTDNNPVKTCPRL